MAVAPYIACARRSGATLPSARWRARSSYAGDQTYAPEATAAKEPGHYRVERVELGVDLLAMHPHVTGAVCLPCCHAGAAEGCPIIAQIRGRDFER